MNNDGRAALVLQFWWYIAAGAGGGGGGSRVEQDIAVAVRVGL
jgi:hypothetical protein